ncbi:MAG: protein kinase [Pirellulaceae bacterium]|nr:protein kinase [Pirellulaceae bacterium]
MTDFSPSQSTRQVDSSLQSKAAAEAIHVPHQIGRYRVTQLVGKGGFGAVFRATDESLGRDVAIKVPRLLPQRETGYSHWESEARMVAMLDHPHIVPVFDVGSSEEYPFFVVSKFIEGVDLRRCLDQRPPPIATVVDWIINIAEALDHAHARGVIHRDVKPSNILIDTNDRPYLTDFGLALREVDIDRNATEKKYVGTFSYMSPEQARGEGHLVDRRADVFSLGIVFYEMLSGTRPFRGTSSQQLLKSIVRAETRAVRQIDPNVPMELERICMKSLAQRRSDRYHTTQAMADDLQKFASQGASKQVINNSDDPLLSTVDTKSSTRVIPKGLRAFDEHDRGFFLKLVPGPQDSDGIPEIIRGLKHRLESRSVADSFRVGLLYGSSGSGKSSLVRAGLIPLMDDSVEVVYVEATAQQTETQLLQRLQPLLQFDDQDDPKTDIDLPDVTAAIRKGSGGNKKVVIILDQFEQWLHAHGEIQDTDLVAAIRQCDGVNLQCLVLIRDDFWMPATRFFHELEVRLTQGVNSTAVDRFELRHARFVLSEFGRAYGCLPEDPSQMTDEQIQFIDTIVDSLQENAKVISIHLVVMAQMLKGREWNLQTLREFGGTAGVDINFLDATFTDSAASPLHRSLQSPARRVLALLLPEAGTDIKGQMQDVARLRQASGLDDRGFRELLEVLDSDLRLITPTVDVENTIGLESADGSEAVVGSPRRCYQLTHDFLVPPLRQWLTRRERQTVRGRTRLLLRELSQYWRHQHKTRFLPNAYQFLQILLFTRAEDRTAEEAKFVAAATKYHGVRWAAATVLALAMVIGWSMIGQRMRENATRQKAEMAVTQLLKADVDNVAGIIDALEPLRSAVQPRLQDVLADDRYATSEKLFARLALVDDDPSHVEPLIESLMSANVAEVLLISDRLQLHRSEAKAGLWKVVQSTRLEEARWLRASLALAQLDPDSDRWDDQAQRLSQAVVNQSAQTVVEMAPSLAGLGPFIDRPMRQFFASDSASIGYNAAIVMSHFVNATEPMLPELLVNATPEQFEVLFPVAAADPQAVIPRLRAALTVTSQVQWPEAEIDVKQQVDAPVRKEIEDAVGTVTDSFAYCQRLPLERLDPLARQIEPMGYRPDNIRAYRSGDEVLVAVIWRRDAKPWRWTRSSGGQAARDLVPQMRNEGLSPADITMIPSDLASRDEIQYGVLWTSTDDHVIDARMYIDLSEEDHASGWGPLLEKGYVPKSNLKLRHPDGTDRYSSVRVKLKVQPASRDSWHESQSDYNQRSQDGWHQQDVVLNEAGILDFALTYGSVWWNGGTTESRNIDRSPLALHRQRSDALIGDHFRPVSLSVVEDDTDGLIAASVWHRPLVDVSTRDRVGAKHANAAIALFRLQQTDTLWSLLEHRADPRVRSFLVNRFSKMGVDAQLLLEQLLIEKSESRRLAIIAALAQYRPEVLRADQAARLKKTIDIWGRTDPSAGIHSICLHLARKWDWNETADTIDSAKQATPSRHPSAGWFNNQHGDTMAVIAGPSEFSMGSPGFEPYRDHQKEISLRTKIPRSFAIATAEVTVQQYRQFEDLVGFAGVYTPDEKCPMNSVSWFAAARYCRWLSEQEGIAEDQMCYPPLEEIKPGVRLPKDLLERTGYRLPTNAEWEYAARAGAGTSRYYGDTADLLSHYAWTLENTNAQYHSVKHLLPNDFGLFDTLGNVMEWTQLSERSPIANNKYLDRIWTEQALTDQTLGQLRGSAIFYPIEATRVAAIEPGRLTSRYPYYGFRVAKTIADKQ